MKTLWVCHSILTLGSKPGNKGVNLNKKVFQGRGVGSVESISIVTHATVTAKYKLSTFPVSLLKLTTKSTKQRILEFEISS